MIAVYEVTLNVTLYRTVDDAETAPNNNEVVESVREAISDALTDVETVVCVDYLRSNMTVH